MFFFRSLNHNFVSYVASLYSKFDINKYYIQFVYLNFFFISLIYLQTDIEASAEEATRLTADTQDENSPEDDDEMCEYHDMPPPPDGG